MTTPNTTLAVERGLAPFQVFQRDARNCADIACSGPAGRDGRVEARVLSSGEVLRHLDWHACGTARHGAWQAAIEGVPVGGEYCIELRLSDESGTPVAEAAVDHVLVGDVWVLAGQSNMQGVGDMIDVEAPSPLVHVYEFRERWAVAEEPLHRLLESPHPVHWWGMETAHEAALRGEGEPPTKGAGLGLPFAKAYARRTGVPVGLVPAAHGGTSMQQWDPALKDQGGESLYGSMLLRFRAAGGRVAGLLWYQGESDANHDAGEHYQQRMEALVAAIRADFGRPDLPFLFVQIARVVGWGDAPTWNQVQEAQRQAEETIPRSALATAVDLELDDAIHIGTDGLKRLGHRLDTLAGHLLDEQSATQRGPRPAEVTAVPGGLRVRFESVNGSLLPRNHIAGFSLTGPDGAPGLPVIDASVERRDPFALFLLTGESVPEGSALWYGRGTDPYCNLIDEWDMAAPVFGPWPIARGA